MKKRWLFAALSAVGSLLVAATVAQAQDHDNPILLHEAGGVQLWSVPYTDAPEGTVATEIHLRSDPGTKLVTFENVRIDGVAHQVWDSVLMGPTAKGVPQETALYNSAWTPYDTHLLVEEGMVGGQAGGGYNGISELNDGSTTDALSLPPATAATAISGIGALSMGLPTDAFFLDTQFQQDDLHWARVVKPAGVEGDVTITVGVLGEGIINSGEPGGAFFDAIPVKFEAAARFCDTSTADVCFDFDADDEGVQAYGNADVRPGSGGLEGGYMSITDAVNSQNGKIIVPDEINGGQFVFGGRTGGANSNHDIDNLEASVVDGQIQISAWLRVGGGTDSPADGFSFNWVRPNDPVLSENIEGWVVAGSPEEGTSTGISIGFDEWQSGDPPANDSEYADPDHKDVIGFSLRVEGEVLGQADLPTLNGALDDVTSLQTGPQGDVDGLGWAQLTINAPASGEIALSDVVVTWKGAPVNFVPEPSSGLMGLLSVLGLALLRRRNG